MDKKGSKAESTGFPKQGFLKSLFSVQLDYEESTNLTKIVKYVAKKGEKPQGSDDYFLDDGRLEPDSEDDLLYTTEFDERSTANLNRVSKQLWKSNIPITVSGEVSGSALTEIILRELLGYRHWNCHCTIYPFILTAEISRVALLVGIFSLRRPPNMLEDSIKVLHVLFQNEPHYIAILDSSKTKVDELVKTNHYGKKISGFCELLLKDKLDAVKNLIKPLHSSEICQLEFADASECLTLEEYIGLVNKVHIAMPKHPTHSAQIDQVEHTKRSLIDLKQSLTKDNLGLPPGTTIYDVNREYRMKRMKLLQNYFHRLGVTKLITSTGAIRSHYTLPSFIEHVQRLINYSSFASDDIVILEDARDELYELLEDDEQEPLSSLISSLHNDLKKLEKDVPNTAKQSLSLLIDSCSQSASYREAWTHLLKIKGVSYESMFASTYDLVYVPEHQKRTIRRIIDVHFPDQSATFLLRTSKRASLRELKPDFYLYLEPEMLVSEEHSSDCYSSIGSARIGADVHSLFVRLHNVIRHKKGQYHAFSGSGDVKSTEELGDKILTTGKPFLIIIEVGYQTDAEGKVIRDGRRWFEMCEFLSSMDIDMHIICFSDSSKEMQSKCWLNQHLTETLASTLPKAFARLSSSSPPGVGDMAISDISSQKFRVLLRTGTTTTTPVTVNDVLSFMEAQKHNIFTRPTNITLPEKIQKQFYVCHVYGSVTNQKNADDIVEAIKRNSQKIVDAVESSSLVMQEVDSLTPAKFYIGSMKTVIEAYKNRCKDSSNCLTQLQPEIDILIGSNESKFLAKRSLYICDEIFNATFGACHAGENHECVDAMKNSQAARITEILFRTLGNIEPESERTLVTQTKSALDGICYMTLPGRTGKQKDVKTCVIHIIEHISRNVKGFLKDSKMLLVLPYKDLCMKIGLSDTTNKRDKKQMSTLLALINKSLDKSKPMTEEVKCHLTNFKKEVQASIDTGNESIQALVDNLKPTCYIESPSLNKSIRTIVEGTVSDNAIMEMLKTQTTKTEKFSNLKDTRACQPSQELINQYNNHCKDLSKISVCGESADPEIIMDYLYKCIEERYATTVYATFANYLRQLMKLMMRVNLTRVLFMYSRVCNAFLTMTSEMTSSGIKIEKIKGLSLNLIIKTSRNKDTNKSCLLTDLKFNAVCSPFYMDKRSATLGSGLFYCVSISILQMLQTQRCLQILDTDWATVKQQFYKTHPDVVEDISTYAKSCAIDTPSELLLKVEKLMVKYPPIDESSAVASGVKLVSCYLCSFSHFFVHPIMANNQAFNTLSQMSRYVVSLALSVFGYPVGVGEKTDISVRKIDVYIHKQWSTVLGMRNISKHKVAAANWTKDPVSNCNDLGAYMIFPHPFKNEREMMGEFYNCHMYNRGNMDYNKACIDITFDTADKHIAYEKEVAELTIMAKEAKSRKDRREYFSILRRLLNIKNVGTGYIPKHLLVINDDVLLDSDTEDEKTDPHLKARAAIQGTSAWTFSSYSKPETLAPMTCKTHGFNPAGIVKSICEVARRNKSYSECVPEIAQVAACFARAEFSENNIATALRDPINCEPISKISTTTSIIDEPQKTISITDALATRRKRMASKAAKLLNLKVRQSTSIRKAGGVKNFEAALSEIMGYEDKEIPMEIDKLRGEIEKVRASIRRGWADQFQSTLTDVIHTNNPLALFSYVKSIWKLVKSLDEYKPVKSDIAEFNEVLQTRIYTEIKPRLGEVKQRIHDLRTALVTKMKMSLSVVGYNSLIPNLTPVYKKVTQYGICELSLNQMQEKYPNTSFPELENEMIDIETELLTMHGDTMLSLCLVVIACQIASQLPLSADESIELTIRGARAIMDAEEKGLSEYSLFIKTLFEVNDISAFFHELMESNCTAITTQKASITLLNFVQILIFNIKSPTKAKLQKSCHTPGDMPSLFDAMLNIIAKGNFNQTNCDFMVMVAAVVRSSFAMVRNILNRSEGSLQLPRSIRSKVVYKLVESAYKYKTTNVQDIAFVMATNPKTRFFSELAPKAQIGASRDLVVNTEEKKFMTHSTESLSKSILKACVKNDGLTNKRLSDSILNEIATSLKLSHRLHGTQTTSADGITMRIFYLVFCMPGDNTKWALIHCTGQFCLMLQQLLPNHPGWVNFIKAVMIRSLDKEVGIPMPCIEKLIDSMLMDSTSKAELRKLGGIRDEAKRRELLKAFVAKEWQHSEIVITLVDWYISQGKTAMQMYNHMGQGIHHATSSVLASLMARLVDACMIDYIKKRLPGLEVAIVHASSSDDLLKGITLTACLPETLFIEYMRTHRKVMLGSFNLMTGLMRAAQMKTSVKTLVSILYAEFYSTFLYFDRISPSTSKDIYAQLFTTSATAPLSLYQSIHTTLQQATSNGLPLLTGFVLTVMKELPYYLSTDSLLRKYHYLLLNGLSVVGRMYLPRAKTLYGSVAAREDIEEIVHSLRDLLMQSNRARKVSSDAEDTAYDDADSSHDSTGHTEGHYSDPAFTDFSSESPETELIEECEDTVRERPHNIQKSVLAAVMYEYYRNPIEPLTLEGFTKVEHQNDYSLIRDPFILLVPTSVSREIARLKRMRDLARDLTSDENITQMQAFCNNLIASSCITENHQIECARLLQILQSKNVIWGLTGKMLTLSVPIYCQSHKAYFFENRTPLVCNSWVHTTKGETATDNIHRIPPEKRVRFTSFLEAVLNSELQFVQEEDSDSIVKILFNNPGHTIFINTSAIPAHTTMLENVLEDLTDSTYRALDEVESSPIDDIVDARRVIINKVSIWTSDKYGQLKNDPGVIIAYYLSPQSIVDARPVRVDVPSLESDIVSLRNCYPNIFNMLSDYKTELQSSIDKPRFEELYRVILGFTRMLTSSKPHKVEIFLFRDTTLERSESNPQTVIKYGLKEGYCVNVRLNKVVEFHNEILFIIEGCIAYINQLNISGEVKSNLLTRFLKCNLKELVMKVLASNIICDHLNVIKANINNIPQGQVSSIIHTESGKIRNKKLQDAWQTISKIAYKGEEILRGVNMSDHRSDLQLQGTLDSGHMSFSCSVGTASGVLLGGRLYLSISAAKESLISSLEMCILPRLGFPSEGESTMKSREQFLGILPKSDQYLSSFDRSEMYHLCLTRSGNYSISRTRLAHCLDDRVIYVVRSNVTTRYTYFRQGTARFHCDWTRAHLKVMVRVDALKCTPSDSFEKSKQILKTIVPGPIAANYARRIKGGFRQVCVASKHLPVTQPLICVSLIHMLTHHQHSLSVLSEPFCQVEKAGKLSSLLPKAGDELPETHQAQSALTEDSMRRVVGQFKRLNDLSEIVSLLGFAGFTDVEVTFSGVGSNLFSSHGAWSITIPSDQSSISETPLMHSIQMLSDHTVSKPMAEVAYICTFQQLTQTRLGPLLKCFKHPSLGCVQTEMLTYLCSLYVKSQLSMGDTDEGGTQMLNKLTSSPPMSAVVSSGGTEVTIKNIGNTLLVHFLYELPRPTIEDTFGVQYLIQTTHSNFPFVSKLLKENVDFSVENQLDKGGIITHIKLPIPVKVASTCCSFFVLLRCFSHLITIRNDGLSLLDDCLYALLYMIYGEKIPVELLPKPLQSAVLSRLMDTKHPRSDLGVRTVANINVTEALRMMDEDDGKPYQESDDDPIDKVALYLLRTETREDYLDF